METIAIFEIALMFVHSVNHDCVVTCPGLQ